MTTAHRNDETSCTFDGDWIQRPKAPSSPVRDADGIFGLGGVLSAADHGVALREVPRIRHQRRRVEHQRDQVHAQWTVGAKYPSLVRAVMLGRVTRTTTRRQAPSRFGFREV